MRGWIIGLIFLTTNVLAQPIASKTIQLHYLQADQVIELIKRLVLALFSI